MRVQDGWQWVGCAAGRRATSSLPYALLLSRDIKRDWPASAAIVAAWILVHRGWSTTTGTWRPEFHTERAVASRCIDIALPIALGGVFVVLFAMQLEGRPLLPLHDPGLPKALAHHARTECGRASVRRLADAASK